MYRPPEFDKVKDARKFARANETNVAISGDWTFEETDRHDPHRAPFKRAIIEYDGGQVRMTTHSSRARKIWNEI